MDITYDDAAMLEKDREAEPWSSVAIVVLRLMSRLCSVRGAALLSSFAPAAIGTADPVPSVERSPYV